jgi:6-phosphogluconolactonase/glucosamine-6-phosphate isomerase/deaminase
VGEDGHTASLFLDTPPVTEARRWVLRNRDLAGLWRVTLTPVVLNAAAALLFIFDEPRKAEAVMGLRGPVQEGREVLLQDAVQNAGFGPAPHVGRTRARMAARIWAA